MARVLIVDDEASLRRTLGEFLRGAGHAAEAAEDADAAQRWLSQQPFDVAVIDIVLPRVSGVELLQRLQAQRPRPVVILMTGEPTVDTAAEGVRLGAHDYLSKPITKSVLLRVVERAARVKALQDDKERLEAANRQYQENLQQLVQERTRAWQESEALYRSLVENLPQSILRKDLAGRFTFASQRFCQSLGQSPEAVLGKTDFDFFPADLAAQYRADDERVAATGRMLDKVEEQALPGGQRRYVQVVRIPLFDAQQRASGVQAIFWDISERKQAEAQIRKLAAFPEVNPNPVLEFSAEGALSYFNAAALALAQSLGELDVPGLLPPGAAAIVQECLATNQPRLGLETRHGKRTLAWSFYPIASLQAVHCYVGELTERLLLEEQFRQVQKLEAIGRLAGGVAHDFNNILAAIMLNVELAGIAEGLPPTVQEVLQDVRVAVDRAANLTRQLLAFSRRHRLEVKPLDLNEVTANMSKMLQRLIGEDIRLETCYEAEGAPLLADPGMMEQVLLNLAVNSRDAMPKGGELSIEIASVELDEAAAARRPKGRPGQFIRLTVRDTGGGIAPEHLPRIFEPFFTTKQAGQGTGLGLATVYGIVEQHRGWIEVHSELGRGTAFHIHLPRLAESAALRGAPEAVPAPARGGAETLLLVEDDAPVRSLIKNALERLGYRVWAAADGPAALELWRQHHRSIELLLTDLVMPGGISGRELAERLVASKPLRVIFMSGYPAEVVGPGLDLRKGLNFVQKPVGREELARLVRDCLDAPPASALPSRPLDFSI
jgi:PAS domain S-box-containing protein